MDNVRVPIPNLCHEILNLRQDTSGMEPSNCELDMSFSGPSPVQIIMKYQQSVFMESERNQLRQGFQFLGQTIGPYL